MEGISVFIFETIRKLVVAGLGEIDIIKLKTKE